MSSETYQKIKASCELPTPTGVALQVLELTQREDTPCALLAEVISTDPALSSRLMKVVNSPLSGLSRQILSVPRAVALMGTRTIASLALSFSLVSNHRKGRCVGFDYELFWSESLACGVAARHLANRLHKFAPDESFTCGLLTPIGRLALATAYPVEYGAVLETFANALTASDGNDARTLGQIERDAFGVDHTELAAEMMEDWRIPKIFCDAVRIQKLKVSEIVDPDSRNAMLARILNLSSLIARVLTQSIIYRDTLSALTASANELGISEVVQNDMFDSIAAEWQEAGTILEVHTAQVPPLADLYALARERRDELQTHVPETRTCPESLHAQG